MINYFKNKFREFTERYRRGKETISDDNWNIKTAIACEDVVDAIWEFYKTKNNNGVYNIGGGRANSCSILETIDILKKKYDLKLKYKIMKENNLTLLNQRQVQHDYDHVLQK